MKQRSHVQSKYQATKSKKRNPLKYSVN